MSKVICDICGTSYPETSAKCPICGYAKASSETTAAGSDRNSGEGGYTAARGGHFSKKNVRKRTGSSAASERSRRSQPEESNTGLILVVIFLLVAIAAVVIYIGLRVFKSPDNEQSQPTATVQVTEPTQGATLDTTNPPAPADPTDPVDTIPVTEATEDNSIPCQSMQLSNQTIEFINAGDTWPMEVRPTPANTTQKVHFTSSDVNVVSVNDEGLLTAVGSGEATITVTCGAITETCQIKCSFQTPSVPPTEPGTVDPSVPGTDTTNPTTQAPTDPTTVNPTVPATTTPAGPVDPNFTFEFNTKFKDATTGLWDTTMQKQGETWRAYKTNLSVEPSAITWTTDDPAVCTVENGMVTAVGPGKTKIHAQYGGNTYSCIVRCNFEVDEDVQAPTVAPTEPTTEAPTGAPTVAPTQPTTTAPVDPNFTFVFNTRFKDESSGKWDTTMHELGETWRAYEKDMSVDPSEIVWTTDDAAVCTVKDGIVTAVGNGKTEIHAQYGGVTYTCIVRVKTDA